MIAINLASILKHMAFPILKNISFIVMAFIAGFVDTATFVGARGLFSAHVTGNFVLFAAAVVNSFKETDFLKLVSFLFFIASNYLATYLFIRRFKNSTDASRKLFLIEGALILMSGLGFYCVSYYGASNEIISMNSLWLMTVVFALGIQNAIPKLEGGKGPATTVMTGNVTQFATDMSRLLLRMWKAPQPSDKPDVLFTTLPVIVSFTVGCLLAAFATKSFGLSCIILPGVLLLLFIFCSRQTTS